MNYIKEIVNIYLGLKIDEEFKIKYDYGETNEIYTIDENGMRTKSNYCYSGSRLMDLLTGKAEIVKLPVKPRQWEEYWSYNSNVNICCKYVWGSTMIDLMYWKLGNCFRTKEEAETKGKELMEKIREEYEQ